MPEGLSSVPWFTSLAGSRSWQQVQDAFANVVGIPLQILDSAGESLSLPSRGAFVCRQMKLDPAGAGQCRHYCGRAVGQAIGKKSTILYKCHAGLVSFAVPVPLGGERNVVILGGHAFTQTTDYAAFMDAAGKYGFTPGDLMEISKTSRIVDGKVLRSASRFLESAGSVVLQNAFQKRESQHYLPAPHPVRRFHEPQARQHAARDLRPDPQHDRRSLRRVVGRHLRPRPARGDISVANLRRVPAAPL
jgi:ligand-binding sensor protein